MGGEKEQKKSKKDCILANLLPLILRHHRCLHHTRFFDTPVCKTDHFKNFYYKLLF